MWQLDTTSLLSPPSFLTAGVVLMNDVVVLGMLSTEKGVVISVGTYVDTVAL